MSKRQVALFGAVVVFLGCVVVSVWARAHYKAWSWQSFPDQFSICGRDYLGPGDTVSFREVTGYGAHHIGHVRTLISTHEVWAITTGPEGDRCGTIIFVRTGSQSFRSYGLSGGP